MARLTIVVDVSGDPRLEDPGEVAEEIVAHAVDQGIRYASARKVAFDEAWWVD